MEDYGVGRCAQDDGVKGSPFFGARETDVHGCEWPSPAFIEALCRQLGARQCRSFPDCSPRAGAKDALFVHIHPVGDVLYHPQLLLVDRPVATHRYVQQEILLQFMLAKFGGWRRLAGNWRRTNGDQRHQPSDGARNKQRPILPLAVSGFKTGDEAESATGFGCLAFSATGPLCCATCH